MRAIGRFASLAWLLLAAATSAHADQAQDVLARVRAQVVTVAALNSRAQVDSEGSGVVVHAGRVVTNCHVVAEAHSLRLTLADGRQLVATRLREDPVRDLCLLEVRELTVAGVARRALADVGQGEAVFAVGNPLGLGLAVSAGVVSAIDRRGAEPRIITSAAVSPGSSGGGLFDGAGRLLGITSSVLELGQNVSVAIPADAIARLERDGRPPVMPAPVTPEPDWLAVAEDLRLRADWTGLLAHAERWQQAYPTSADALASAGLAEGNLGRLAAARERLVRGAAAAPWHALTSGYLARTYLALGDYAAAEAEARRATRLQPSGRYYWGLLGDALRGLAVAMHTVAAVGLMIDPRDLGHTLVDGLEANGVVAAPGDPAAFDPTVYIYDQIAGGVGLGARLFEERQALLVRARKLMASCDCADGCPSCVGPTIGVSGDPSASGVWSRKGVALSLLRDVE